MAEDTKKKPFNLQYFIQTRRFLAITIGLSTLSIFVGLTILFPNMNKSREAYTKLNTEKKKLASLEQKNRTLQNVNETDIFAKKDAINAILPSKKPLLQLLNQVDRVSGENSVIISEFGVIPGEISTKSAEPTTAKPVAGGNPNIDILETKLVLVGKIENVNAFLKAVNNITPLTQTTELSLKAINRQDLVDQQKISDPHVYEATLTLTSYFYKGKVQTETTQVLPELSVFTAEDISNLDIFQIPISSQVPVNLNIEGGGKEDLFE